MTCFSRLATVSAMLAVSLCSLTALSEPSPTATPATRPASTPSAAKSRDITQVTPKTLAQAKVIIATLQARVDRLERKLAQLQEQAPSEAADTEPQVNAPDTPDTLDPADPSEPSDAADSSETVNTYRSYRTIFTSIPAERRPEARVGWDQFTWPEAKAWFDENVVGHRLEENVVIRRVTVGPSYQGPERPFAVRYTWSTKPVQYAGITYQVKLTSWSRYVDAETAEAAKAIREGTRVRVSGNIESFILTKPTNGKTTATATVNLSDAQARLPGFEAVQAPQ